jgi:lysyl-tRNA synthetase class 1
MDLITHALKSNAWPFVEARALLKKLNNKLPEKGYVLFETGYGPSGLPHIGTFGEVVRTTMVRKAFELISDMPTRLFCVSDDMDGMRKIPDTIPNKDDFLKYMDLPLTAVPDPFGTHASYGAHMNARLQSFLDKFGFEYEFLSSTECYKKGTFNQSLLKVLHKYDEIMAIMLPTLGEERQKTYSPFLPVDPESGKVLQVPILELDKSKGTITYKNLNGNLITSEVTDGKCKLQWKPDFGMRWEAFDVDFEMYGKDHLANGPIYTKICKTIGGKAPQQMFYELFLDEKGEKISKTKGNGISIEQWLRYATQESLSYFMYISPQKAKRLYFDVIPKCVDEYLAFSKSYETQEADKRLDNPVYHIHSGHPPIASSPISYSLLLNLVSACNTEDANVIWGYIKHIAPQASPDTCPMLAAMMERAINYYDDFIKPNKNFRPATAEEKAALQDLVEKFKQAASDAPADEIQNMVYAVGKEHNFDIKEWFTALYEILLGASQGPRFGSFVALYGLAETIKLIEQRNT